MINLLAKLGLDISPFTRALNQAEAAGRRAGAALARDFGPQLKGAIGGAMAGSGPVLAAFGQRLIENAGQVSDLAEQYQLAVRDVLALQAAAGESGIEFERLGGAIDKLGNSRKDAATKNEALRSEFAKFGVTLADLQNPALSNLDLLKQMGAAMQGLQVTPATREAFGEIVGEKGQKLLEFIRTINEAKPLALVTEEQIGILDRMGDRLTGIARSLTQIAQAKLADAFAAGDKAGETMKPGLLRGLTGTAAFFGALINGPAVADLKPTEALTAADIEAQRATLAATGPLFTAEPTKPKTATGARAVTADNRIDTGTLGRAGLFTAGQGTAPILRELNKQTDLQGQSVQLLRENVRAIREEI